MQKEGYSRRDFRSGKVQQRIRYDREKRRWKTLMPNDRIERFFRSFDRHSDKIVTLSELLQDINNFSKTIVNVIRKSHELRVKIVRVITIVVSNPVNFLVNARLCHLSTAS